MFDLLIDIGFTPAELFELRVRVQSLFNTETNDHSRVFFSRLLDSIEKAFTVLYSGKEVI